MKTRRRLKDEQGIAFPVALIVMVILTALMAAFAVLATSEPQISTNHMAGVQARALAESGLERALWALTTGESSPGTSGVLVLDANYNLPSPVPAPYDGATFVSVSSVGGFKVTVANGAQINEKVVTAVGYVPNEIDPVAVKKIKAKVTRVKWINPVCGLCAGGENPPGATATVRVGGAARVNATTSPQGGGGLPIPAGSYCSGVTPVAAVATTNNGTINMNGTPELYAPGSGGATLQGSAAAQTNATFPPTMTLTDSDMATLKAVAKAQGTYIKPAGCPGPVTVTYQHSYSSSHPDGLKNGLVFVDTCSGNPFTDSSPDSDRVTVDVHGDTDFSGWLIVAGSVSVSGNVDMNGLIYAQNDVTLNGTGNSSITGAVISTNRKDTTQSTIADAEDIGNGPLSYNCPAVRSGGGQISQNWFVLPGSYQELSGRSLP